MCFSTFTFLFSFITFKIELNIYLNSLVLKKINIYIILGITTHIIPLLINDITVFPETKVLQIYVVIHPTNNVNTI